MTEEDPPISGTKAALFSLFLLLLLGIVLEGISYLILKSHFGEFSLEVQGNTTMVESPYQVWEHPNNYTSWSGLTHFNNQGFRRFENIDVEKKPGTTRIFIFGGSSAFGSQAMPGSVFLKLSGQGEYSTDETISAYLEMMLNKRYPSKKFEVINAATNWSRIHQQSIHYLRKIRSLKPDLILSIDGQNDSLGLEGYLNIWEHTSRMFETELLGNLKHKLRFIFKRSYTAYLAVMIIFRWNENYTSNPEMVAKYKDFSRPNNLDNQLLQYYQSNQKTIDGSVEEYVKNMAYFDAILKTDGVPHAFFLQPQTIMDNTKKLTDRERAIQGYMYSRIEHQLFRINFFNKVAERGMDLRENQELNFANMMNIFGAYGTDIYSDYCHFTPEGNKALAKYLLNYIEDTYPEILQT